MKVKKLTVALAATAATALYASGADAYNLNQVTNGCVVTNVIHNGLAETTAVGIVSRDAGTVYWVFFDEDSNHVVDGEFDVTENDFHPFIWANEAGIGLEGVRGYLVFSLDIRHGTNNPPDGVYENGEVIGLMSANALHVNTANQDVAFVPVIPLTASANNTLNQDGKLIITSDYSDYYMHGGDLDLTTLQAGDIWSVRLTGVDYHIDRTDLRYYIDNAPGGNDTWIAFWTADELDATPPVNWTIDMYDAEQNRASVNFPITKSNMNFIDVETIVGRPADFLEGFLAVDPPDVDDNGNLDPGLWSEDTGTTGHNCPVPYILEEHDGTVNATMNCIGGYIGYSIVSSSAFGAVQTLLGMHD